ncbi:MAG: OmpA family protein [Pseudomonadota bacterium]
MTYIPTLRAALTAFSVALATTATPLLANPFAPGWVLEADASALRFTSVKNGSVTETSSFATYTGLIDPNGTASVNILLDSVDTKVDLRNVRMRFLFFETFKFPEATVSMQLTEEMVAGLAERRRMVMTLPFDLTMRGITRTEEAEVAITLLGEDMVSVSSYTPVTLKTQEYDLEVGRGKLEEAAGVTIVPQSTVSFDFVFARLPGEGGQVPVASAPAEATPAAAETATAPASGFVVATPQPTQVALETAGDFSLEECAGRFEILSRTGNIYFSTASARLRDDSRAVLDSIADIIGRCPGLKVEVSGHTDSDGSEANNQRLSERRAASVVQYLSANGAPSDRMVPVGYGESRPIVANDSAANKQRNRRIEFALGQ